MSSKLKEFFNMPIEVNSRCNLPAALVAVGPGSLILAIISCVAVAALAAAGSLASAVLLVASIPFSVTLLARLEGHLYKQVKTALDTAWSVWSLAAVACLFDQVLLGNGMLTVISGLSPELQTILFVIVAGSATGRVTIYVSDPLRSRAVDAVR